MAQAQAQEKAKTGTASPRVAIWSKASAAAPPDVAPKSSDEAPEAASKLDTPLLHLNSRTGPLAMWDVAVSLVRKEDYEYSWDGKPRKGQVFRCYLVSVLDPTKYCLGEVRKEKGVQANFLDKAESTFKDGHKSSKSKPEHNSSTHKVYVNLHKTTIVALMQPSQKVIPLPAVTCADCVGFKTFQCFDITSLVHSVSEARVVGGVRFVRETF